MYLHARIIVCEEETRDFFCCLIIQIQQDHDNKKLVITLIHYIFLIAAAIQARESTGKCIATSTSTYVERANKFTVPVFDSKETCLSGCKLIEGAKGCEYDFASCNAIKVAVFAGDGDGRNESMCWIFS